LEKWLKMSRPLTEGQDSTRLLFCFQYGCFKWKLRTFPFLPLWGLLISFAGAMEGEGPSSPLNRNEFYVHSELVSHSRRESQALLHPSSSTFLPSSTHQDVLYQQQLLLPPTPPGYSTSFRLKVKFSCQVREPRPRSTRTLEDLLHFQQVGYRPFDLSFELDVDTT
jgi:hypothetical protein